MQSTPPVTESVSPAPPAFDLAAVERLITPMIQAVVVVSPEGIRTMNAVAKALFGDENGEMLISAERFGELFDAEQLDGTPVRREDWPGARALRGEVVENMVLRLRHRESRREWINNYCSTPYRDEAGQIQFALLLIEDISERLKVETALRVSEERYRSLMTTVAAVVWTSGSEGEFREPQSSWQSYTGQPWSEQRGFGWVKMIHEADRAQVLGEWRQAVATCTPFEAAGRLWHAVSQEYRYFEARAVPLMSPARVVREWVGTCVDVHERWLSAEREREARREAEAANRAKDEFLAVLSHELRTPLMPALLTVADVVEDPSVNDDLRGQLEVVLRNIELETRLIDDLLDHTRIKSGKLAINREVVNAADVVRESVRDVESDYRRKDLTVRLNLEAPESYVSGDAIRIRQMVWNLVRNAIKFTPLGGRIEVSTSNPSKESLAIKVRDSGIGISPEMLPRIFSRFEQGGTEVTRRYGGLGLGLAITKSLVDLHGGVISASSDGPGKGSTFTILLPTAADPRARIRSELVALRPPPKPLRILLVEDHDDTRNIMAALLRRHSHTVTPTASLAEARAAGEAGEFDLVVSDLGLPDGDGRDLLPMLPPGLRAISLSGFGTEQDVARSRQAGFAAHLTKPVDFARLRGLIQEVMAAPASPPASPPAS